MTNYSIDLTYSRIQQQIFHEEKSKYVIVPKGRRVGGTRGGAQAWLEYAIEGITPMLWGDTTQGNIERYVDRYFLPPLKASNIPYKWNQNKKELVILNSVIDFRSAERPENWEGFGYKKIMLNEAGIILSDNYLYNNAILPMLMDFTDSQLYAVGTPKGKLNKDGSEHLFYTLYKRAISGQNEYKTYVISSYQNPFLSKDDIHALEMEMSALSPEIVKQEIYGEFIDSQNNNNPFVFNFDENIHVDNNVVYSPNKQLLISIDFNVNPITALFANSWKTSIEHFAIFDEVSIMNGSIQKLCEYISYNYKESLQTVIITGDAMGKNKQLSQRDNASYYDQIKGYLALRPSQIQVNNNPTHENSRANVNYVLAHYPDFTINTNKCTNLLFDIKNVQCDIYGGIVKRNRLDYSQRSDMLDNLRYLCYNFLEPWRKNHSKFNSRHIFD